MSNLWRSWQRLYDKSLDPKVDVFLFIVALAVGVLCLWVFPPSIPHLVQRMLPLFPDIWERLSSLFVIVMFGFAVYVVLLAVFFKRLEKIRVRRLRTIRTTADRIHLFAHRIGLVFAGILLISAGIPLLLHKGVLTIDELLPPIALVSALLRCGLGSRMPRLIRRGFGLSRRYL